MKKINAGIIGGAGYTAGELIRILLNHPYAEVAFVQSTSHTGAPVTSVHRDLEGETGFVFTGDPDLTTADVLFLCQGHGKSKSFLQKTRIPDGLKVIDLSTDFRINDPFNPFVYGLPELNRDIIRNAAFVANPGCFATGIELAFLPLAAAGLLRSELHVQAVTGSTGAGQMPSETSHFSWREGNISAYKIFEHQHQEEILQTLCQLQPGFARELNFIPIRGNFTRGIFVSAYTEFDGSAEDAFRLYSGFFDRHPFTIVTRENPSLKLVVNTNKALVYTEKHGSKLVIVTCSDNLLKGASGQAVQNMNLMFGLDETAGLRLKPVAF
jgi:N-acetyl-gamma-glutamyl-phosphate reductase